MLFITHVQHMFINSNSSLLGAFGLILADALNKNAGQAHALLGDIFALSGALLYGCSNVMQEYLVKKCRRPFLEILGFILSSLKN